MSMRFIFCTAIFWLSSFVFAAQYPAEFADFFEPRLELIDVSVQGLAEHESLLANISYDTFQLPQSASSVAPLKKFLLSQNLSEKVVAEIIEHLEAGINANPNCGSELSSCMPDDVPGQAEFIFDYEAKRLRIFVSSEMFNRVYEEREYYEPMHSETALVNWSSLYAYSNQGTGSFSWRNDTQIGLPVGYASIDSQYQSINGESSFDLYHSIYSFEKAEKRFLVGYQDSDLFDLNSTDFLVNDADLSGFSATFARSSNLVKGGEASLQRLTFFAPQGGRLEVYKGERLLFTKVVNPGEQSIRYDELPQGNYLITLRLMQGNDVAYEEQRKVVNLSTFDLPVGGWDYRLDIGRFDKPSDDSSDLDRLAVGKIHRDYARVLGTYRVSETLLLGSGVLSNGETMQWNVGTKLAVSERIQLQYTADYFSTGDVYQSGLLSLNPFSFSIRQLDSESSDGPKDIARILYGNNSFKEYSASVSGAWANNQAYLYYYRNKTEHFFLGQTSSDNVSLILSRPFLGGDLSVNASFSSNEGDFDRYSTGISWNRRFGSNIQTRIGVDFNGSEDTQTYADTSYTYDSQNWRATPRLEVRNNDHSEDDLNASVSVVGEDTTLNYDAYGSIDSHGNNYLSGSMSGTQVVSKSGVKFTSQKGQAFIELAPSWQDENMESPDAEINYSALRNGSPWYSDTLSIGQEKLINLPIYTNTTFALDTDSKNIEASTKKSELFVMPGTYHRLESQIVPLNSQIFVLSDAQGDAIKMVQCFGQGCKNVELLSDDGVFRVNYRPNLSFHLMSGNLNCNFNPKQIGDKFIKASCKDYTGNN